MSTDTYALIEVADAIRALEAIRVCATTTMPDPLQRVADRYSQWWRAKEWEYDTPDDLLLHFLN